MNKRIFVFIFCCLATMTFFAPNADAWKKKYKNGDFYEGKAKWGKPDGQGTMQYASGDTYVGTWLKGLKFGYGKMTFVSGDFNEGKWENDVFISGKVRKTYPDGIYTGDWKNDCRDGEGTMQYADGRRYIGTWKNNCREGQGKCFFSNGNVYKGTWNEDIINGEGTMQYADGRRYIGTWKNNCRDGQGKCIFSNGNIYEGTWSEDAMNGEGKLREKDGSQYSGIWSLYFFEGIAHVIKPGFSYDGTCSFDYNPSSLDVEKKSFHPLEGSFLISRPNEKGHVTGKWRKWEHEIIGPMIMVEPVEIVSNHMVEEPYVEVHKYMEEGTIEMTSSKRTINVKVDSCQIRGRVILPNEEYNGIWTNGVFNGEYTLKDKNQEYHYKGKIIGSLPVEGVLSTPTDSVKIHSQIDSHLWANDVDTRNWRVECTFSNGRTGILECPDLGVKNLFEEISRASLPGLLSKEKMFSNNLEGETYYFHRRQYPMEYVAQNIYMTFYSDGYVFIKWSNEEDHISYEDFKKNRKHSDSICPSCMGSGIKEVHGFSVDGYPYTTYEKCIICGGKGKVKADNFLANAIKDMQEYSFLTSFYCKTSDGRDSREVATEKGYNMYRYDVKGDVITIRETGGTFTYANSKLISQTGEAFYQIKDGFKYYDEFWEILAKNAVKNQIIDNSFFDDNKTIIPFSDNINESLPDLKLLHANNVVYYESECKEDIEILNASLVSHEFDSGKGKIVLDRRIEVVSEDRKKPSKNDSAMSGLALGGSITRNYEKNVAVVFHNNTITEMLLPSEVSDLYFRLSHIKPFKILLTTSTPPNLHNDLPDNFSVKVSIKQRGLYKCAEHWERSSFSSLTTEDLLKWLVD